MDEFFSGLDSRLLMSVKVADSIMMGLVNAAMEDAYKKSLWKGGDLERLFQKLRFCELAIMQLEWSLRFVRCEMESSQAGSPDDGHDQLLDDLLETRDRIQARLDEAQLAVAEKDRDYMRRMDAEPRLRLARGLKGEELSSLLRRETATTDEQSCVFGELMSSVDRRMSGMRGKLEDACSTLAALMQKVSGDASPMARLQEAGHEGDGVRGLSGFYSMAQLLMEFQEMVVDAGTVRDSIASSFDMMEGSVSLLRATLDEQQWMMNAEKEMYGAVVEGFLMEINAESRDLMESFSPIAVGMEWPGLVDDLKTLQDKLVILDDGEEDGTDYQSMSRVNHEETSECEVSAPSQENPLPKNTEGCEGMTSEGQVFPNLITDHENNILQKSQESNSSKMAPCGEKAPQCICNSRSFDKIRESAARAIARVNAIRNGNGKLISNNNGSQHLTLKSDSGGTENNLEGFESLENEIKQPNSARQITEKSDSGRCYHSEGPGNYHQEVKSLIEEKNDSDIRCELKNVAYVTMFRDIIRKQADHEEIQRLTEENTDLNIKTKLQNEIYTSICNDLVRKLTGKSIECFVERSIKQEVQTILTAKTLSEWKSATEMAEYKMLIKEQIDCIVFGGLTKDSMLDLGVVTSADELRSSNNLGRFSMVDKIEQIKKMKIQINITSKDKGEDLNQDEVLVNPKNFSSDNYDKKGSKENDLPVEVPTDNADASDSVNGKVEQALEQENHRKLETRDVALSLSKPLDRMNLENGHVALVLDEKHGARHPAASNVIISEKDQMELQSVLIPFTNCQQIFMDFEALTAEKIGTTILRLRDLDKQLLNLVEQVSSLKRSELLYRRAFTWRCYELQKAEAEVDLLGDEVDMLLGLLKKTCKALERYSPVLQHYIGIREILKQLGNELGVERQIQ